MLFFWLLNYLQKEYNPESFTVEVWDKKRIRHRIQTNKSYLDKGIIDKLEFVENAVVSKRFRQLQSFLWLDKYKKHFKVFGWWEVLDESRKFPHNGWNLFLLHHYSIRKKNFILVGWIGTDKKKCTKELYKHLLPRAKKIICREEWSMEITKEYSNNIVLHSDFSKEILSHVVRNGRDRSLHTDKFILINVWPKYYTKDSINKIKNFVDSKIASQAHNDSIKKIFFPADINFDKEFYPKLRKIIPDLEIYDRTKHPLSETLSLFKNCEGWIWSRLHFLYPLKLFKKDFVSISNSDKVKKMI
jgi:polysaccharide pyruvyl transferase WcaK-like protein